MQKVLRFFEYDKVKFSQTYLDAVSNKKIELERYNSLLRKYHTKMDGLYYDLIDNGIRFKEQVGVLQVDDLTIEVLPKIDRHLKEEQKSEQAGRWHDILLEMLKECKFLLPQSSDYAHLKLKSNNVLELYFEKYVIELELLLHRGLIKKYSSIQENCNTLKGKLMFNRHLQQNLVHAERFYVKHSIYSKDHLLHQVLSQALVVVKDLSGYTRLTERINTLLSVWPKGNDVRINEDTFNKIVINRKTKPYDESVLIAKMILLNYHPDLRGGSKNVFALMFNMNGLWEEFIFQRLKSLQKEFSWKVSNQKQIKYWTGEKGSKKLIPDIIIECQRTKRVIVIDTKWKCPPNLKPDDHDLRQLLSYKLYFQGDLSYLLYPGSHFIGTIEGKYENDTHRQKESVFKPELSRASGLIFLSILKDQNLISRKEFSFNLFSLFNGFTFYQL